VRIAVAPGAPIISCRLGGRDWCDAGPWRDYAPTLGACSLPTFVTGAPRGALPEGGAMGSEPPDVQLNAAGAAPTIRATWRCHSYPVEWTRTVSLENAESVRLDYAATNTHRVPLPFVWGLRVPLAWRAAPALDVPRAARAKIDAAFGDGLPRAGSEFIWPSLREGGRLVDLSQPTGLGVRRSVACYVELSRSRFSMTVQGTSLELGGEAGVVTHAHVLVNNDCSERRHAPRRWWRRGDQEQEIVIGPSIGAPGLLSDALGSWNAARWIEPGDSVHWTIHARSTSHTPPP
jgi:hypothetical protein